MIVGDNMNIPKASRMLATTRSSTMNGTNTTKPISNAVQLALNLKADKTQNTKKPVNFSEVLDMFTAKGKKQNAFSESEAAVDNLLGKQ